MEKFFGLHDMRCYHDHVDLQHTCSTPQLIPEESSDFWSEPVKRDLHSRTIVLHVDVWLPCYKVKLLVAGSMTLPIPSRSGSQQSLEIYTGEVGQMA